MTAFLTGAEALAHDATQGAARIPRATQMGGDGVVQLGAGPLQAVDVSTGAGRSASEPAEIMVVAVGDALEREGALTGGAHPPASAGLVGVHGDHHAIGRVAADHTGPRSCEGSARRCSESAGRRARADRRHSEGSESAEPGDDRERREPSHGTKDSTGGENLRAWELGGPYLSEVQSGGLARLDGS